MIRWRGRRSAHTPPNSSSVDQRQRLRSQDEAEVGRRARALRDEQRQRHDDHAVADRAGRLAEEQISEVGVAQNAQVRTHKTLSRKRTETARRRERPARSAPSGSECSHGRERSNIAGEPTMAISARPGSRREPAQRTQIDSPHGDGDHARVSIPPSFVCPSSGSGEGYYSDAYFVYTKQLLEAEGHHPRVTMQVFQKQRLAARRDRRGDRGAEAVLGPRRRAATGSRAGTSSTCTRCTRATRSPRARR